MLEQRRQQWEPVPVDAIDIRRPHPPPPTSFPSPRSRRRRRRRRYPAALATTGAGAAAATGPEPAPPTTGGSGGRICGRGNKNTVAYPVAEQDMQKRVQSSRRASRRAQIGAGLAALPAWRPCQGRPSEGRRRRRRRRRPPIRPGLPESMRPDWVRGGATSPAAPPARRPGDGGGGGALIVATRSGPASWSRCAAVTEPRHYYAN